MQCCIKRVCIRKWFRPFGVGSTVWIRLWGSRFRHVCVFRSYDGRDGSYYGVGNSLVWCFGEGFRGFRV